jgi:hypothetical protein
MDIFFAIFNGRCRLLLEPFREAFRFPEAIN